MTRTHRWWHRSMWLVIAPLLVAGLVAGIVLRPRLDLRDGSPPAEVQK